MKRLRQFLAIIILVTILLTALPVAPAHAATITVQSGADDGTENPANCPGAGCRLRDAIAAAAASGDTITFAGNYTIRLASPLTIQKNVTIDGVGRTVTLSGDTNNDGNGDVRVFYISSGGTLNLNQLTVTKGNAGSSDGGGIRNYGTLNVTNSTFSGNSTNHYGGGIYNWGTLTVTNSTFSGNSATYGGGIDNLGMLNVTNSTFSGNSATYGGSIDNLSMVTVTNSTFSGNSATYGGGIDNLAGTVNVTNSIVANTTSGDNCSGAIVGSNNLADDNSCGAGFTNSSSILLGALGSYGGDTQTIPLLPGSSAIDAGSDAICAAAPVNNLDQRGVARPQGEACDIGAFELVDNTLPELTSFTYQTPAASPTNADTLIFRATFSEPVENVDTTDFVVNSTSTATVTAVNQVTNSTYDVTVSGGDLAAFNGTFGLNLSGAQDIEDYLGNDLPAGEPAGDPAVVDQVYTLDNAGPLVIIDSIIPNPTNAGTTVSWLADEDGTYSLRVGGTNCTTGTEVATGAYIAPGIVNTNIVAGNLIPGANTIYICVTDALINTGSTTDSVTQDITDPLVTIDSIIPDPTNAGTTVSWHADEDGTYSVRINSTDCTNGVVADSGTYSAPANVDSSVAAGDLVAGLNSIRICVIDAADNTNWAIGSVTQDATAPSLISFTRQTPAASPTNADTLVFRATFSEGVQNVDAGDFFVNSTSSAGITAINVVNAPTNTIYDITVSGGDLDMFNGAVGLDVMPATAGLNITDLSGNALPEAEPATDQTYLLDNSGAVTSILRQNPLTSPTNLTSGTFRVTFAEDMQNVDTTDFALAISGTATGTINSIIVQSASVYDVVITGVSGNGVLDLNFTTGNDIADLVGNLLGASPAIGTEQTYTIDNGFPTVIYNDRTDPEQNATLFAGPTRVVVEFNKDVLADGSADAANTLANYLLVEAGVNGTFDTLSCGGGLQPDDAPITINSISYSNGGGAGPFLATLNINNGTRLSVGSYRLFICGTTSVHDLAGNHLNNGADSLLDFNVRAAGGGRNKANSLPATGFAPGRVTLLPPQMISYTDLGDLWLEIPKLGVKMPIVGVPQADGEWDVSWLGTKAGWLEGSAYPSWNGNSVITGHVWNADNSAGPFVYLNTLWWGDKIIVHVSGKQYVYEVRSVKEVKPTDVEAMLKHEELPWLTLVSCKGYDEDSGEYHSRVLVRAVLVEVK